MLVILWDVDRFNLLGYALKDVAVFYIMQTNPAVFVKLGRSWDGDEDENSYCHVSLPILMLRLSIQY